MGTDLLPAAGLLTAAIIILYALALLAAYMLQNRLVYSPSKKIEFTPEKAGLAYREITFFTSGGIKLSGWFIPAENRRGVILFCHGKDGNISHRLESLKRFNELHLSTFIFDYRGFGKSDGKPSEEGTYEDAEAAWLYLIEQPDIEPDDIVIYGRSLGGPIAARLASLSQPKGLVLESTFTSINEVAEHLHPYLPVRRLSRFRYNTLEFIKQVTCPVLIIHSPDDDLVPFAQGLALYEAANQPKTFLEISGLHYDGYMVSEKAHCAGLDKFIDSL